MTDVQERYRLSPMQEGILFYTVTAPGTGAYMWQLVCSVGDEAAVARFERAWRRVIARHPILRSGFVWEGMDEPLQVVSPHADLCVEHLDWRGSTATLDHMIADFLVADRRRGFDLARPPLLRLTFLRADPDRWSDGVEYRCAVTSHHLLLDGWSAAIVVGEVIQLCDAYALGEDPDWPDPPRFRDYVEWVHSQDPGLAEDYWRRRLRGITAPTSLPFRTAPLSWRPAGEFGYEELHVPEAETARLVAMARRSRVTPSTLVQGAWAILLSRYCRERSVLFGTVVAGRSADVPGVESMVGLLINTLPTRIDVDSSMRLGPWLQRLQADELECREFEHSRLVDIQGWSEIKRGGPMFESILTFQNYPVAAAAEVLRGGADSSASAIDQPATSVSISCLLGNRMKIGITYENHAFEAPAMARLAAQLAGLLERMADEPQARVGTLEVNTAAELDLMAHWNATRAAAPATPVHRLIEAQAAAAPDAVAVVAAGRTMTYGELNERADQVAHDLQVAGVGPDDLVAVRLERSTELVVAVLGILKAGAAYVPLDPEYPDHYLDSVLAETDPQAVLTADGIVRRSSGVVGPGPDVRLDNLAYVMYTSGSTGRPKGVMISHRGLANRLGWMQDAFRLRPDDAVLHKTSIAFDVSVWELLWPLATGARLVVARPGGQRDPRYLVETIVRESVTTAHFVPSMLHAILDTGRVGSCRSLRRIVCSGERLDSAAVAGVFEALPNVELHNLYGPTEATIDVTAHRCRQDEGGSDPPIGRPIRNTRAHVLDEGANRVPPGGIGELFIGGLGLARGYLGQPGLTAERFVPSPFDEDGERLYRTGDLVRHGSDGTLAFLGRMDDQLKIRGFRVEPAEVESGLLTVPSVRQAAVVAGEDAEGRSALVAYLVREADAELTGAAVREQLVGRLPHHMMPAAYVFIDALPLTPSGKLDKRALRPPALGRDEAGPAYVAPRSLLERQIVDTWSEILHVPLIGVHDDFFQLGGHSLLAMSIVGHLADAAPELDVADLFDYPTVAGLAAYIETRT